MLSRGTYILEKSSLQSEIGTDGRCQKITHEVLGLLLDDVKSWNGKRICYNKITNDNESMHIDVKNANISIT